ncbi:MAG: PKD domain-containing protein [Methanospirillaceae archaeon]|nr:PKD domain-containing protein [Methanospirillaceae archaeon]
MKERSVIVILLVLALSVTFMNGVSASEPDLMAGDSTIEYRNFPSFFIPNEGQFEDEIAFEFVRPDSAVLFSLTGLKIIPESDLTPLFIRFEGISGVPEITGENIQNGTANFYLGADPDLHTAGVPLYESIRYEGLYPGIDLVYSVEKTDIKSVYEVNPGFSPDVIALRYEGCNSLAIHPDDGKLLIQGNLWNLSEEAPYAYQEVNGVQVPVECSFVLLSDSLVGFLIGEYDTSLPLIIDPIMRYSLFFGGDGVDHGNAIATDDNGYAYLAGSTTSAHMKFSMATNLYEQKAGGERDAFVVKINPDGTELVYITYLGGKGDDLAYGITIDADGDAYVTGSTNSEDFPTQDAYHKTNSGRTDVFLTKIDSEGRGILFSTFLGGSGDDIGYDVALDSDNNIFVTGSTTSWDFPIVNKYELSPYSGLEDGFITKLDSDGESIIYSNYIGGSARDLCSAVVIDPNGYACLAGQTDSPNFPTINAYQNVRKGVTDAFVVKFDPEGTYPAYYSTYLGGKAIDIAKDLVVHTDGSLTITGQTFSSDFPVTNAFQRSLNGVSDAFITTLSANGSDLTQSSFMGGSGGETGNGIGIDDDGNLYIIGTTLSTNFPIQKAYQSRYGGGFSDAFVTKLDSSATSKGYATYLGGYGKDEGNAIAVNYEGDAYLTGYTDSTDFPKVRSYEQSFGNGDRDAFVAVLADFDKIPVTDFYGNPTNGNAPLTVSFYDTSKGIPTSWSWDFGDGEKSVEKNPVHIYKKSGTYSVTLQTKNIAGSDTKTKSDYITVTEPVPLPVAGFVGDPRNGSSPLTVIFTDLSTGNPDSWEWSFGDSGTSTEQNPVHVYQTAGTFTVTLTVTNAAGMATKIEENYITVVSLPDPPHAAFSLDPKSGNAPLLVRFTDLSTGEAISSWFWNFGDGQTSSEQNPVHTYTSAGTFDVSLTVTNPGGSDTALQSGCVTVGPEYQIPVADFTGSPTMGMAPLTVSFTDLSLNNPLEWVWDFGDETTSLEQNPLHVYTQPGTYSVDLFVSNPAGMDHKIIAGYITVLSPVEIPDAEFSAAPRSGYAPLAVYFTDQSTGDPETWQWDFGDGSVSTERNPSYVYTEEGMYTVSLTVANSAGQSEEIKNNYIIVEPEPIPVQAAFIGEPRYGNAPLTVQFTDLSTGGPESWLWSFGDGTTSTERNPVHVYKEPGIYTVYLTVMRGSDRSTEIQSEYITVYPGGEPPVADFIGTPTAGNIPLHVQFTDISLNEPEFWSWNFGDGQTSQSRNPTHIFQAEGSYTITLSVRNAWGESTEIKRDYIAAKGIPQHDPATFYGEITVYGDPGPIGSIIEVRGPGIKTGIEGNPITITNAGVYGLVNRLKAAGEIKPGEPVTFWVRLPGTDEWIQAECYEIYGSDEGWMSSYPFIPGKDTYLTLRIGESPIPPMPVLPNEFYGDVTYNGAPLVPGSLIVVRGQDVREGVRGNPLLVTEPGRYGIATLQKLVAQGDIGEGTPLTFWIIPAGSAKEIQAECYAPRDRYRDKPRESPDDTPDIIPADTTAEFDSSLQYDDNINADKRRDKTPRWTKTHPYHEGYLTQLDLRAGSSTPAAPVLPATFSGTVSWEGKPLPVGSIITAEGSGIISGVEGNPVEVKQAGIYGDIIKLTVQGDIRKDTPVSFTLYNSETGAVQNAECRNQEFGSGWSATYPFVSGTDTTLDIRFNSGPIPAGTT